MEKFLVEHFEAYLEGNLGEAELAEFQACLARASSRDRARIERMAKAAGLFDSLDIPETEAVAPSPGFHLRVLQAIRDQGEPGFWNFLTRPTVLWRVSLATCTWLLVVVSVTARQTSAEPLVDDIAQQVLAKPPESADYCNVRLGCDIEGNRASMLATVMYSEASGR